MADFNLIDVFPVLARRHNHSFFFNRAVSKSKILVSYRKHVHSPGFETGNQNSAAILEKGRGKCLAEPQKQAHEPARVSEYGVLSQAVAIVDAAPCLCAEL